MRTLIQAFNSNPRQRLLLGLLLGLGSAFLPGINQLEYSARATMAILVLTAWCWLSMALPLPIASLLPALLLPAAGVMSAREVAPLYFQDILMLFLGGFILALALELHGLHRRFALRALSFFGNQPRRVVLGFMVASAGLSMFVSNTSTAILMLPVALAVIDGCSKDNSKKLAPPLLLGIAYACSIGGVGTPIGTAPNSVLIGQTADKFPNAPELGFGTWMIGTLPFIVCFLFCAWLVLTRVAWRLPKEGFPGLSKLLAERKSLPTRNAAQNKVAGIFIFVALAWITRQGADFGEVSIPGWQKLLPLNISATISDATVALLGVVALFSFSDNDSKPLIKWEDCRALPWGVLLLLGGGFALAKACEVSGLSQAAGEALGQLVANSSPVAAVFIVSLVVTFLTEITSNTATINLILPLLFSTSVAAGLHPMMLAVPATMAVSCAFMLPVATPPNAILFGSGRLRIGQMARAGFLLNLLTAILVTIFALSWTLPKWDYDIDEIPSWSTTAER